MNFQNFRQKLRCVVGIAMFSLFAALPTVAQEGATFSGRVVDELGNPVRGIRVSIRPFTVMGGGGFHEPFNPFWSVSETGLSGRFVIRDIVPESVRLSVGDERRQVSKLLSVQIGALTLYPERRPPFGGLRFALEPGMNIKDVVITVKTDVPPQIRARVVSADGTPLPDAEIYVSLLRRHLDGRGFGDSVGTERTDGEGYFVRDLRTDEKPQFYTLGVEYQGLFAKAVPFIFQEGQPQVHLLLKLNETPLTLTERLPERMGITLERFLNPPAVWAVNPANGHAYKRLYCHSIMDAMAQATAEDAYLVAINDEAEAVWLQDAFRREHFWIGLTDVAEEGHWVWQSGEPVTYTNWVEHLPRGGNTEINDYVISAFGGSWEAVAVDGGHARNLVKAVIERAELPKEDLK